MVMRSFDDHQTVYAVKLFVALGIQTGVMNFDKICPIIDPYLTAFYELHKDRKDFNSYQPGDVMQGIHLAFWLMEDELDKLPTDVILMSALMQRCLDFLLLSQEQKMQRIANHSIPSMRQVQWYLNLFNLRSVNQSLVFGCLWTLLHLWEHIHKSDDIRAELTAKRF